MFLAMATGGFTSSSVGPVEESILDVGGDDADRVAEGCGDEGTGLGLGEFTAAEPAAAEFAAAAVGFSADELLLALGEARESPGGSGAVASDPGDVLPSWAGMG